MYIHATESPDAWRYPVYHCERGEKLINVLWVNDETHQYYEQSPTQIDAGGNFVGRTVQAKRIAIIRSSYLVLINPVGDPHDYREVYDAIRNAGRRPFLAAVEKE